MERCNKCIMPVTSKGLTFNENGICKLCEEFEEFQPKGKEQLLKDIEPYLGTDSQYNAIVPVSGGRDSSYALYYAKEILGLRPLAVHNDNDFETEIATKNLDIISKKLNVDLVRVKSKNGISSKIVAEKFKMNIPFGTQLVVDQTCEACQYGFESATYNIARKYGIKLIFWGDSKDESTAPYHKLVEHKTPGKFARLFSGGFINFLKYKYYYKKMQDEYGSRSKKGLKEIHLYDYIRWDQRVIVDTITNKLGWSVPKDSPTTWRVDCSLVPLVNYLTDKSFGVSKIELGFSNMVRSGKMDRSDAIKKAEMIRNNTDPDNLRKFLKEMGISKACIDKAIQS